MSVAVTVAVAGAVVLVARLEAGLLYLLGDFVGRLLEELLDVLGGSHSDRWDNPRMR